MPEFEEVHQALRGKVAFLGINTQDTPDAAARIVERTGVTYDLARDPDAELFAAFRVFGMPSTYFVSARGEILDSNTGALTKEALEAKISELFGLA
jgi:peroxiredoxin